MSKVGWQKCPCCNGTGIDQTEGTFNAIPVCSVCKGKKIISIVDGRPPQN